MIEKINKKSIKIKLKKKLEIIRGLTDEIDMIIDNQELDEMYEIEELEEILESIKKVAND